MQPKKEKPKAEKIKKTESTEPPKKEIPKLSIEEVTSLCGLTDLVSSHAFFSFEPTLTELIGRKVLFKERNLSSITGDNFFILYELIPTIQTSLSLYDIFQLEVIRLIMSGSNCHLIIQIADEEAYAYTKLNYNQIKNFALEKVSNVLSLLTTKDDSLYNKIHIFFNREFHLSNNDYENFVTEYKMRVDFDTVVKLFSISDEDNVNKLDYPTYIACASNSEMYSKVVPEIQKDAHCLIVNQINKMNRYVLCFDCSEKLKFSSPAVIAFDIIPQLTGKDDDCYTDDEHTLLLCDDDKTLRKKIMKHSLSGSRGSGSLEDHKKLGGDTEVDISCRYLKFFEYDSALLKENVEKFGKGEISCGEIKQIMFEKIAKIFNGIKANKHENIDKFFINLGST